MDCRDPLDRVNRVLQGNRVHQGSLVLQDLRVPLVPLVLPVLKDLLDKLDLKVSPVL